MQLGIGVVRVGRVVEQLIQEGEADPERGAVEQGVERQLGLHHLNDAVPARVGGHRVIAGLGDGGRQVGERSGNTQIGAEDGPRSVALDCIRVQVQEIGVGQIARVTSIIPGISQALREERDAADGARRENVVPDELLFAGGRVRAVI